MLLPQRTPPLCATRIDHERMLDRAAYTSAAYDCCARYAMPTLISALIPHLSRLHTALSLCATRPLPALPRSFVCAESREGEESPVHRREVHLRLDGRRVPRAALQYGALGYIRARRHRRAGIGKRILLYVRTRRQHASRAAKRAVRERQRCASDSASR
jgi:hypothetical protein